MRRERIDIAQTYLFTANTWARLAAIIARVPVIVTSERNVDMWEERFKPTIGRWLDRFTYRTTGNSQAVKDYLVKKGLAPDKVDVIYNGVDPERFEEEPVTPGVTRSELGIPPHHSVVGLLARLEPQKDPLTFLRAAAILVKKLPTVSCLVIGGGSLQAELEREAQALGLGTRVTFTGPRRDVARLLAACDVSVISSVKEGMSNTIMESMAAGKPMVATRVGGNAELIAEGETGFLVPPRDPDAIADAVLRILEDPDLAKAMGHQARVRIAQRFSVEAMVKSTERLYGEALGARESDQAARGQVPGASDGRIALVASQFPRNVDAYFVREIAGLAARGLRFRIFSLRAFGGKVVHASARPLLKDTVYAAFLLSWPVLRANARFAVRRPARYFGALARLIAGSVQQSAGARPQPRHLPQERVLRGAGRGGGHPAHPRELGIASGDVGLGHGAADGRLLELRRARLRHLSAPHHAAREDPGGEVRRDLHAPQQGLPRRRGRGHRRATRSS